MTEVRVIKGSPSEKWKEVQAIQHEPFIYIMSCGSHWAGEEESDVSDLLQVLGEHRLDYERFGPSFYGVDPCRGVDNPNWQLGSSEPRWIDGPRLYSCNGVVRFFGNFENISHGFNIDTNHKPTIDALIAAIDANAKVATK